ncbi:MAG: type III-B CRISPR module-associated protein Cmr5, partial [Anaerolineae bacterium]|nr:type III-B CRISPR module-associated protein Cmr5 [Anaerolineae bacterium]
PPHWTLYQHLSEWIGKDHQNDPQWNEDGLLEWLIQQDSETYRRTTVEVIAYLNWLKRFAEAILPEKEGGA